MLQIIQNILLFEMQNLIIGVNPISLI